MLSRWYVKLGAGLLALLAVVAVVLAVNTWRQGSRQLAVPALPPLTVDIESASAHLSQAIRARTVSSLDDPQQNADAFVQLHGLLASAYPQAHRVLKREVVGGLSLLYTWPGSDSSLQPMMLMAHQDVVPIAAGTEGDWEQAPFDGVRQGGVIWGRGSWDDKGNLIAQMEAVEMLAASGFQPRRTLYLAFGADEEVGGLRGAAQIATLLKARGVRLDFVLDEGLLITEGVMPGLKAPAALIGVAEKGYLSVVLNVSAKPGHSSMPPPPGHSAVAMMSAALQSLDQHQMPAAIRGVAREMFDTVAPEMGGFNRVALSNLWLFGPVVQRQLEAGASTNAMLRSTTALTVVNAGNKDNVLPGRAQATVNYRLLPGDSQAQVMDHVKQTVAAAVGVDKVQLSGLAGASEPSAVSPTQSASYQLINRTVRELFPGTLVAPGLMIGATDSRHFQGISDHIYRFSPVRAGPDDLPRFHGTNERIAEANLAELIRFYHRLIGQASAPAVGG
jgi:carboxypeptidase PM20D1